MYGRLLQGIVRVPPQRGWTRSGSARQTVGAASTLRRHLVLEACGGCRDDNTGAQNSHTSSLLSAIKFKYPSKISICDKKIKSGGIIAKIRGNDITSFSYFHLRSIHRPCLPGKKIQNELHYQRPLQKLTRLQANAIPTALALSLARKNVKRTFPCVQNERCPRFLKTTNYQNSISRCHSLARYWPHKNYPNQSSRNAPDCTSSSPVATTSSKPAIFEQKCVQKSSKKLLQDSSTDHSFPRRLSSIEALGVRITGKISDRTITDTKEGRRALLSSSPQGRDGEKEEGLRKLGMAMALTRVKVEK